MNSAVILAGPVLPTAPPIDHDPATHFLDWEGRPDPLLVRHDGTPEFAVVAGRRVPYADYQAMQAAARKATGSNGFAFGCSVTNPEPDPEAEELVRQMVRLRNGAPR